MSWWNSLFKQQTLNFPLLHVGNPQGAGLLPANQNKLQRYIIPDNPTNLSKSYVWHRNLFRNWSARLSLPSLFPVHSSPCSLGSSHHSVGWVPAQHSFVPYKFANHCKSSQVVLQLVAWFAISTVSWCILTPTHKQWKVQVDQYDTTIYSINSGCSTEHLHK